MTPIDTLLDKVNWVPTGNAGTNEDGIAYATHEGVLRLGGFSLKVAKLSTGERVINSESLAAFLSFMDTEPT